MEIDLPPLSLHEQVLRLAGLEVSAGDISATFGALLQRCMVDLPADVVARLHPYIWMETGQVSVDSCQLGATIQNTKLREKTSRSDSWILFGTFLGREVAVKLSAVMHNAAVWEQYIALEVEREIYEKVINSMLLCGYTPHVLAYYAKLSCDDILRNIANERDRHLQRLYHLLQSHEVNQYYDGQRIRAIVTERAYGKTLAKKIEQFRPTEDDFNADIAPLLFQLFFTLQVFGEIGLMHNDLHSGNVFVEDTDEPVINYYQVDDQVFRLITTNQVRIFDFDRSVKLATPFDSAKILNPGLQSHCRAFGQCNVMNQRSELYTLAVSLYQGCNATLADFLTDIVPDDLLRRMTSGETQDEIVVPTIVGSTLSFSGRLCACNEPDCVTCAVLNDERILLPKQILAKQQFLQFRVEPSQLPPKAFIWKLPSQAGAQTTQTWHALSQQ